MSISPMYLTYGSCKEITIVKKQTKTREPKFYIPVLSYSTAYSGYFKRKSRWLVITFHELGFNTLGESSMDVMNGTWWQDIAPHHRCRPRYSFPTLDTTHHGLSWVCPCSEHTCIPPTRRCLQQGLSIVLMTSCLSCFSSADIPT